MSFQAMAWAVKQVLPSREKLVLLMAANYADEYGKCWPSNGRLMSDTGMTKNTIIAAFRELESRGLLRIEHRSIEGVSLSNMYHLKLSAEGSGISRRESNEGEWVGQEMTGGSSNAGGGVVQEMNGGGSGNEPKPINEPINREPINKPMLKSFERFWECYPRKTGKGAAEKAWILAGRNADADQIILAVENYHWPDEPKFIPHPATWLNQKRWLDEAPLRKMTLAEEYIASARNRTDRVLDTARQLMAEEMDRKNVSIEKLSNDFFDLRRS